MAVYIRRASKFYVSQQLTRRFFLFFKTKKNTSTQVVARGGKYTVYSYFPHNSYPWHILDRTNRNENSLASTNGKFAPTRQPSSCLAVASITSVPGSNTANLTSLGYSSIELNQARASNTSHKRERDNKCRIRLEDCLKPYHAWCGGGRQ